MKKQIKKTIFSCLGAISLMTGLPIASILAQVDINIGEEAAANDLPGSQQSAATDGGFGFWIGRVLNIVLVFATLMVFINYIIAALEWITASGDSGKIQKARDRLLQSTIGLIVLSATTALIMLLQNFLNIDVINFTFVP
jgi:hypothetical protein